MSVLDNTEVFQDGEDGKVSISYIRNIAVIEMDCGENKLNVKFIRKMHAALDEVERNPQCKAVITTNPGNYFSNGADLSFLANVVNEQTRKQSIPETEKEVFRAEMTIDIQQEFRTRMKELYSRILTFPVPTVAAINGHCFGGGAVFSLAHDFRVMKVKRGFWCLIEVHLNIRFNPFSMELFRCKLTPQTLTEAVTFGKRLTSKEAYDLGIITRLSEDDTLIDVAVDIAEAAAGPTGINRSSLQTVKSDAYKTVLQSGVAPYESKSKI